MILLPGAIGPLVNVEARIARRALVDRQDVPSQSSTLVQSVIPTGGPDSTASVLARQSALTVSSSLTIIFPTYTSFTTPSSSTAAPAATSVNSNPSNPSSKQLGLAIGASVGVPIGVIILLASCLTCLWQWKRRSGPIGALALRREEKRASRKDSNGSREDDKDLEGVGMKKLEAGYGRKKKSSINESTSQGSRKKGIDVMAASLAAKSSVAAKEAVAEAESRKTTSPPPAASAMKQRFARFEASVTPNRRSRPAAMPVPDTGSGEQRQRSSESAGNWPTQLDVPDPPIAPIGVMQDLRSTTPVNPLRSHPPPMPLPDDDYTFNQGQYRSSQQYPRVQSFSRPLPPRSQPSQESQSSQPADLPPRTPTKSRLPLRTHYENYPSDGYNDAADADISEEETVSALPPLPAQPDTSPRKSRLNTLQKPTSLLHKRSQSGRGAGHSDSDQHQSSSHSHHTGMLNRRGSNDSYRPPSVSSHAWSSRPTSPKSVTDSLPRTSPAFHVQAELQRRAQERSLWEQRRMIGESYGRLMRDWNAGPARRMGDGRDFVDAPGSGGQDGYAGNNPLGRVSPASAGRGVSPSPRIPTLRGPGSRGERREAEPRRSADPGSRR